MPKPIPTKKIPPLTLEQMEEIFMDRLAHLIVRLMQAEDMVFTKKYKKIREPKIITDMTV